MNLGFFCPEMAVSWRISVFQKLVCWNPYFYSVLGVRAFWAKLSKKAIFGHPPKKKENLTDNWKAPFLVFLCFCTFCFFVFVFFVCFFVFCVFVSFLFFLLLEGVRVRWGGPKGHLHLALNSPYLLFVFCCFCRSFSCFCFLCFFGGFKGQVRWPKGPPHLALNPPYLLIFCFCFCCFCSFPFFAFEWQKTLFSPLKSAFFCLFSVFLFLSPSTFFGLPLFLFLFLCLSLALVLFFLSSLSFFFLLSFGPFFFSLSHFSFFFAFVFWKEQHAIYKLQYIFSSIVSLFYGFLSCLSLSNPFFLSLLCSWYSVMFSV